MASENITVVCAIADNIVDYAWKHGWKALVLILPFLLFEYKRNRNEKSKKQFLKDEYKSNIVSTLLEIENNVEQYLHIAPSGYLDLQSEFDEKFIPHLTSIISKSPDKINPHMHEQLKDIIKSLKEISIYNVRMGNDIPEFNKKCENIHHECSELIHAVKTELYM